MKNQLACLLFALVVGPISPITAATIKQVYKQAQSSEDFKQADRELNRLYKNTLKTLPEDQKKAFQTAQRQWVAGQQATVDANPGKEVDALLQYTLKRIEELNKLSNSNSADTEKDTSPLPPPQEQEPFAEDLPTLNKLAEKGDPRSQFLLGLRYLRGDGVKQNKEEAVKWLKKSVDVENLDLLESGASLDSHKRNDGWDHGPTLNLLGSCYANGEGVERDEMSAAKYFKLAANLNNPQGKYNLGLFLENGHGGTKDIKKAASLYREAAEQGLAPAQHRLGVCYFKGEGVEENKEEAVEWFEKAARQGWASAENSLGFCYDNGEGVTKDASKALQWYKKAAEHGNSSAQFYMGNLHARNEGAEGSTEEAVRWYKKAANQAHPEAQVALGTCYILGKGVTKNFEVAASYYKDAADQGLSDAQFKLGVLLAHGKGVEKDATKARQWITKAAANAEYYQANKDSIDAYLDKSSRSNTATDNLDNPHTAAIKIKGFYIGMNIESARDNLVEKLGNSNTDFMECRDDNNNPMIVISNKLNIQQLAILITSTNPDHELSAAKNRLANSNAPDSEKIKSLCRNLVLSNFLVKIFEQKKGALSLILSDSRHQVHYIKFSQALSNYLFNSANMESTTFAEQFSKGYKIRGWQVTPNWQIGGPHKHWSYTSADGVKITLYPGKDLVIQKVPSKEEQSQSFD